MELGRLIYFIQGDNTQLKRTVVESKAEMQGLETRMAASSQGISQGFGRLLPVLGLSALGIRSVTSAVGDSIRAHDQEAVGIARMGTLLQANIPLWDGNTTAVERTITARQRLSFDDSKLRDSLGILVARTHDVSRAFDLQTLSMDLARGKIGDLETASNIIGKVYSGNTAILTRYGIQVDKNATSEQALAALQRTYGGQAAAYANTAAGASDRLDTALGNLSETIGGVFSPSVKESNDRLADWIGNIDRGITKVTDLAAEAKRAASQDPSGLNAALAALAGITPGGPTSGLESLLEKFNTSSKEIVKTGGVAGQGWTTELVGALGAGRIKIEDAVAGNLTAMQVAEAAQAAGGKVGQGYSLFTGDGVAMARPALESEVGLNNTILERGMQLILDYQEKARLAAEETLRLSSMLDAHDRRGRLTIEQENAERALRERIASNADPYASIENARNANPLRDPGASLVERTANQEKLRQAYIQKYGVDPNTGLAAISDADKAVADAAKAATKEAAKTKSAIEEAVSQTQAMSSALTSWIDASVAVSTFRRPANLRPQLDTLVADVDYSMMAFQKVALKAAVLDKDGKTKSLDFLTEWLGAARSGMGVISETVSVYKNMEDAVRPSRQSIDAVLSDTDYVFSRQKEAAAKYSVDQMALTQLYAQTNQDVFQSLSTVASFTGAIASQREDVRGQIRLLFTNADEALRIYTAWSASWKEENMERAGRIGKNIADVFGGINSAFQAVLGAQGASLVADYEIDDAMDNVERTLSRIIGIMDSPVFGGDFQRRANGFNQSVGGLFDTFGKGMDLVSRANEGGGEWGFDPNFFMDSMESMAASGPSASALGGGTSFGGYTGGGNTYNNCIILPSGDVLVQDPDVEKLVARIRSRQTSTHGAVIGAPN